MKTSIEQIINRAAGHNYVYGLLSFISYGLSFLIGYEDEAANSLFIPLKALLILISAFFFVISCNDGCSVRIRQSYSVLSAVILIYEILLLFAVGRSVFYIRYYTAVANSLIWIIASAFSLIRFRQSLFDRVHDIFSDRGTIALILSSFVTAGIVIILSSEPNGVRFTWDSDTLYQYIYELDLKSLYDAKLLTFHSHVVAVYAYILVLLKLLLNNIRIAYFILNALCIMAASFGMTFLLKTLVPGRKVIDYFLANAVFLFSPWVCGLSTYHMYDYYIWCLFPLLAYYLAKRNWIGFFSMGIMISFSKTTGIAVFGFVCVGLVAADLFECRKISSLIRNIKYWYFASVALIFYIFFRSGISESTQFEDTVFGIDPGHISHLLKLYSTANFLWIFVILTAILVIGIFFAKRINVEKETKPVILTLFLTDILFILFNSICITYRLPRYMDSHIAVVYICSLVLILEFSNELARYLTAVVLTVISLISSFKMIDPVSLHLFNTINVGSRTIVDFERTDSPSFEDSIVCNREYYSYEILLDKVLTYVINEKGDSDDILFSLGDNDITWGLSGGRYSYGYYEKKSSFELFYDKTIDGLANGYSYRYYDSPDMIPFNIKYIFPQITVSDAVDSSEAAYFYYIYMPSINSEKEKEIFDSYEITSENSFYFRGWQMNCIRFAR